MSVRTELELTLTKLSDRAGLKPVEVENSLLVEGRTVTIRLNTNSLKIDSITGQLEIKEKEIESIKFFRKSNHCLINLKNGILRIYPESGDFRFFVNLG